MKVPIARTDLNDDDIQSVLEPLKSGWLVQGPKVREFEKMWSTFTGSKQSIAVTSCTSGLHLSLAALGFSHGDEAIVPAFTWISTANVVEHLGGKVIFADIDLDTFNINVDNLKSLITERTKVILPVHLFGLAANMTSISEIAKANKLWVVEDAACGFGSSYKGQHVGTFGNTGCFSFHPRKAITTGEGGMVTTNDDKLAEKIRCLRDHGAAISDLQRHQGTKPYVLADHIEAGYNQRMTDIQAALGVAQMKRANSIILERRRLAEIYENAFKDFKYLDTPNKGTYNSHGFQSFPCLFEPKIVYKALFNKDFDTLENVSGRRNKLMELLQSKGIATRPATHAVHMLKVFKEKYQLKASDFPNALAAYKCSISLPLFHGMTNDEQDYVISSILESFGKCAE